MHPVATALRVISEEVNELYLERRAVIEAMMMAILAKEHLFLLGDPGTGKSAMVREVTSRFAGASYFETLLSKTRPDAAVLGPYDIPMLREHGAYRRRTAGYLPTATFSMLDEVGKMSPTLGHDLLAVLNERVLHEVRDDNRSAHPVPLHTAFCPSNELIVNESADAAALWDRLLVRTFVAPIEGTGNFVLLLTGLPDNPVRTTLPYADLADVVTNVVPSIALPQEVLQLLVELRDQLRSAQITVSDRRWRQCVKLLQASAFLNGRSSVAADDLHVLRFTLWDGPEQIKAVERLTLSLADPTAEKALRILDDIDKIAQGIRDRKGKALAERAGYGTEASGKLRVCMDGLTGLRTAALAGKKSTSKIDEVLDRAHAVQRSVYVDCLDMPPSMLVTA